MKGYILRIEFVDLEPKVWRRVIVPDSCTFRRLHETIQFVTNFQSILGTDMHLYEFNLITDNIRVTNDEFSYDQHKDFVRNKKKYITYVPEQCNDEKLKKVLKVNDFRHFFLDFIIVTYYN